jgi:hypothetical protein
MALKPSITVIVENMDTSLFRGTATLINRLASPLDAQLKNPAFLALPPLDRRVWELHQLGYDGVEIGIEVGKGKWDVCRILHRVRLFLEFLAAFRDQLEADPEVWRRFIGCKQDPCRHCEGCPAGKPKEPPPQK